MAYDLSKQLVGIMAVLHKLKFEVNGETISFVHRDLKPENLSIRQENGQWKCYVIDFGHASGAGHSQLVGTPMFEAPEYVMLPSLAEKEQSYKHTDKADMWAVGLVIMV